MGQNDNRRRKERQQPKINPLAAGALGLPEGLISDVQDVTEALDHLSNLRVNLLAPLTRIEFIPPGFRLAFRAVVFPTDDYPTGKTWKRVGGKLTNGTWYETDGDGLALHKAPLRHLASAAGLSWETFDLSTDVNRWTVKAVGRLRTMDGQWRQVSAIKDVDLRDEGPIVPTWAEEARRKGKSADYRVLKAREYGNRMAESKAVNALIRDALGIRGSYDPARARAPFVFPLLVWTPETPEARQLQAAVELGVVQQVYGPASEGRGYAEAGTVIDADGDTPRALPDHGEPEDLEAELDRDRKRRAARQPVRRGQREERGRAPEPQDYGWTPDADPDW